MNISNLKIGVRLSLLAGLLQLAVAFIGFVGWQALSGEHERATVTTERAILMGNAVDTARHAQVLFKTQIQEWKNTLLRGNDPASFEKYRKAFTEKGSATQESLRKLKEILAAAGLDTASVDETQKSLAGLQEKYLDALKQYDSASKDSAHLVDAAVKGMDRAPTDKIDGIVAWVLDQSKNMAESSLAESAQSYTKSELILATIIALAVAAGAVLTLWMGRSITGPLREAVAVARTVATGDLTCSIRVKSKDETGQLLQALKDMNDSLVRIVGEVRDGTESIATGSQQIASGNADLSSRTESQAGSLEETASSMEELTSTVKQNADNARQANQLALTASDVAVRGGAVVSEVVETMGAINDSARKIVDIIAVIDGIAFQTNILALNAAVEAARAGEQGRGFAVVASEVRSLAQRSAQAAKEIKVLIDNSVAKVDAGSKLVNQAGATMQEVVQSIRRVTDIVSEISAASQEQTDGIEQINQAITQMDEVTQQNAALVEESAAAAEAMRVQAGRLAQVVGVFKVDNTKVVAPAVLVTPNPKLTVVRSRALEVAPASPAPLRAKRLATAGTTGGGDWEEF